MLNVCHCWSDLTLVNIYFEQTMPITDKGFFTHEALYAGDGKSIDEM